MKKKIFNIIELLLQTFAIVLLFISGAYVCYKNCGLTYSLFEYYSTPWKIIVLTLFASNLILCLVSIIKNSTSKDSAWHVSLPIINVIISFPWSRGISHDCTPYKLDIEAFSIGTTFLILLFILVVIIFVSFIKRSNSVVPKKEIQPQQVINNVQETSNADELKKYKDLLDSGVITQEEFDQKKKQLLGL